MNVFLAVEGTSNCLLDMISKYSSYDKLLRVTCFVLRFIDNLRRRKSNQSIIPTATEMKWSFYRLIEAIQKPNFLRRFLNYRNLLSSNIQRLTPFIHTFIEEGRTFSLLRVGGTLLNGSLPYDAKFPLLLPKQNDFATLYLRHLHFKNCHAGTKGLIAISKERIWLINAKEKCSRIVCQYVHCFRYKPRLLPQIMSNLPTNRVRATLQGLNSHSKTENLVT